MADEKIYGIAESKSKVEVPRKADVYSKSETYSKNECYSKSETYSQSQADTNFLRKTDGAPKNHASTANTYGLGTLTSFGHCKLTTSLNAPSGDQNGIALAGSVGYTLKSAIDSGDAESKSYTDDQIAALPDTRVPVGCAVLNSGTYTPTEFAQIMGYGTWEHLGTVDYSKSSQPGVTYSIEIYRRVS